MPRNILAAVLIALMGFATSNVLAVSPTEVRLIGSFLIKGSKYADRALPAAKIEKYAVMASKPGGTKLVGEELATLNLPNAVIEDTFARILVYQGRVSRSEADGWMKRLSGVDGFRAAMRKSMGASPANTIGHVNEIRLADSAAEANYRVRGIGVPFRDPNKSAPTDIDVLLESKKRLIAIEAKAYPADRSVPLDTARADMETLAEYRKVNQDRNVLSVFAMTNRPSDENAWKALQLAAEHHNVQLLVGPPSELVHQLRVIGN